MEKKMETITMGFLGTTIRISSGKNLQIALNMIMIFLGTPWTRPKILGDMLSFGGWTGAPKTRGALASSADAIKNFWTLEFLSSHGRHLLRICFANAANAYEDWVLAVCPGAVLQLLLLQEILCSTARRYV